MLSELNPYAGVNFPVCTTPIREGGTNADMDLSILLFVFEYPSNGRNRGKVLYNYQSTITVNFLSWFKWQPL